jgi:hypothetical protein
MGKVEAIIDFLEENIYDSNLPFIFAEHLVCCKKDQKSIVLFRDEKNWKPHEQDIFDKYQWEMMTPYFKLSCEGQRKVNRMPLEDRAALPFTDVDNIAVESGFSMVRKVKIHTAHYNAHDFSVCCCSLCVPPVMSMLLKYGNRVQEKKPHTLQ